MLFQQVTLDVFFLILFQISLNNGAGLAQLLFVVGFSCSCPYVTQVDSISARPYDTNLNECDLISVNT